MSTGHLLPIPQLYAMATHTDGGGVEGYHL